MYYFPRRTVADFYLYRLPRLLPILGNTKMLFCHKLMLLFRSASEQYLFTISRKVGFGPIVQCLKTLMFVL